MMCLKPHLVSSCTWISPCSSSEQDVWGKKGEDFGMTVGIIEAKHKAPPVIFWHLWAMKWCPHTDKVCFLPYGGGTIVWQQRNSAWQTKPKHSVSDQVLFQGQEVCHLGNEFTPESCRPPFESLRSLGSRTPLMWKTTKLTKGKQPTNDNKQEAAQTYTQLAGEQRWFSKPAQP